jgi:hypothetical protein
MEMDFLCKRSKLERPDEEFYIRLTLSKINAIMLGIITLLIFFTFPETLFSRDEYSREEGLSYWKRLTFHGKVLDRPLQLSDFANNFEMMRYWAVFIPCVYYAT